MERELNHWDKEFQMGASRWAKKCLRAFSLASGILTQSGRPLVNVFRFGEKSAAYLDNCFHELY